MITREYLLTRKDGVKLYTTRSTSGLKIRQEQTGAVFDEAVDVENAPYTYTETDEPVNQQAIIGIMSQEQQIYKKGG